MLARLALVLLMNNMRIKSDESIFVVLIMLEMFLFKFIVSREICILCAGISCNFDTYPVWKVRNYSPYHVNSHSEIILLEVSKLHAMFTLLKLLILD